MLDTLRSEFSKLQRDFLEGPIYPEVTASELRDHLSAHYPFDHSLELEDILADVEELLRTSNVQITHPRYMGLFNPSVTLASVLADVLVAIHNPQLASWNTSPAANEIERYTLGWLAKQFGFPENTLATFTTGGTEANLSAVICALTHAFPEYGKSGLRDLKATPTFYITPESHHSFQRIAHVTGIGRSSIRIVATTDQQVMDTRDLQRQIALDRKNGCAPFMIVGTCGTTTAGIIDPLSELGHLSSVEDLWFHVDAAWGGAAIVSPVLRKHLAGIETADSLTCDAHKWFSVPMGCGMFFCRHRDSVSRAFGAHASYMPSHADRDTVDPYLHSMQWSRRFSGLKLFMSLAHHGASGYAEMIERQTWMGDRLRQALRSSGWEVVNSTPLPLVCFTRDGLDVDSFLASMRRHQIAWVSGARLADRQVVRACITSFKTTESDILWVVDRMNDIYPACLHATASENS